MKRKNDEKNILPIFLKWNRNKTLKYALKLKSASKNIASVAIVTVRYLAESILNSNVQFSVVVDFRFRILGNK